MPASTTATPICSPIRRSSTCFQTIPHQPSKTRFGSTAKINPFPRRKTALHCRDGTPCFTRSKAEVRVHFDVAARFDAHAARNVGFECAGPLGSATSGVVGKRDRVSPSHFSTNKTNNSVTHSNSPWRDCCGPPHPISKGSNGNFREQGEGCCERDFNCHDFAFLAVGAATSGVCDESDPVRSHRRP